ncbi:MAG: beta-Ala-His dipeptidase [Planctomycetota bacterium]
MTTSIEALEPKSVWNFFAGIAAVPRPSKHEEKIRVHTRKVAEELGYVVREDRVGNMVIEAPASPGCEMAPITVLQGHLDMVCEKNADTEHDFDNDGIRLIVDKDPKTGEQVVRADGTTLGADNGIGLAMAFAAASSPEVKHGPLEILCTIDEEMGMTGAKALVSDFFKGKKLLNLDSEDDTMIYIGCAGGGDATIFWDFDMQPIAKAGEVIQVKVSGLRGGHSGGNIHENRGNANKVLVQTLMTAGVDALQIAMIAGGSKRNALAREAGAIIVGPAGALLKLQKNAEVVRAAAAHQSAEPNLAISVKPIKREEAPVALSTTDTLSVLRALTALPHGVLEMHQQVAGLVQTSNNVATIAMEKSADGSQAHIVVGNLCRSSMAGKVEATWGQLAAVGHLAGATVETGSQYPGWDPDVDSPLLATCQRIYEELFGAKPEVAAIHAGLECGIIGQRMGKLDMVSFGPRITGAHSPDEQTYPESVQKSYKYLCAVLAELAEG